MVKTTVTITDMQDNVKKFTKTKTFTGLTAISDWDLPLAADETKIVWDPITDGGEPMTDFNVLIVMSDGNVDLELVTDVGADVGDEATMVRVVADLPLMLGSDVSKANVTGVDVLGTGTLDVIDKIRVDEPATAARKVKFIMAT